MLHGLTTTDYFCPPGYMWGVETKGFVDGMES